VVPLRSGDSTRIESEALHLVGPRLERGQLAIRIIIHLSLTGSPEPDGNASPESTQQGMAARLGATQGAVSKVLQGLVAVGMVRHEHHRVRGEVRRVRAYFLTAQGVELSLRCRAAFPELDRTG
jgi:DNA-binding MarR family transcriptional regulator